MNAQAALSPASAMLPDARKRVGVLSHARPQLWPVSIHVDDLWHSIPRAHPRSGTLSRLVIEVADGRVTYSDESGVEHVCLLPSFLQWATTARLMARAR